MANLHPFQRAHDANNYMTLDMFSTNNYGYKDLPNNFIPYQINQNDYYFTRQINPLSLATLTRLNSDPSNLPSDKRLTIYNDVNTNDDEFNFNQYQNSSNNPNLWKDNLPAKSFYYTQRKKTHTFVKYQISMLAIILHFKNTTDFNYIKKINIHFRYSFFIKINI